MPTLTQRLANPTRFLELSERLLPWLGGAACVLLAIGRDFRTWLGHHSAPSP